MSSSTLDSGEQSLPYDPFVLGFKKNKTQELQSLINVHSVSMYGSNSNKCTGIYVFIIGHILCINTMCTNGISHKVSLPSCCKPVWQ